MAKRVLQRRTARVRSSDSIPVRALSAVPQHRNRVLKYADQLLYFRIPSDLNLSYEVVEQIMEQLKRFGIVKASNSNVYVALIEAISNAITHGNRCEASKTVEITAEFCPECAAITVRDQGRGFKPDEIPDPRVPENLLTPGGRGVLLIKYIMDEVRFNKRGNEIVMVKYANAHRPQGILRRCRASTLKNFG